MAKDWFTLSEAAERSGLGNTTIRSKIKSGELKAVKRPSKHGRRWEISRDSLAEILAFNTHVDEDLGGVRGVTISSAASERSEGSEGAEASDPAEVSDSPRRASEGQVSSDTLETIHKALLVAEQAREDHLGALRERDDLLVENDRLRRQVQEVHYLLSQERRLLAENAESLIEKEAALKEVEALKEQQAEEILEVRSEFESVLEDREGERDLARAEAAQAKAEMELLKTQLAELEQEKEQLAAEQAKPWWKKMLGG